MNTTEQSIISKFCVALVCSTYPLVSYIQLLWVYTLYLFPAHKIRDKNLKSVDGDFCEVFGVLRVSLISNKCIQ